MLAYCFAGFLFYTWKRLRLAPTVLSAALLSAVVACVLLSFSTTGYFVLAGGTALIAVDLLARRPRLRAPRLTARAGAIAALIVIVVGAGAAWAATRQELLARILDVSLFAKGDTSSFHVRSTAEMLGLQVLIQTGGLGIGLGSHKANSLLMTLLSNVGLVGTAIFGAFLVMLLRPLPRLAGERNDDATPLRFFILGLLLVHMVSNPNFNVVVLWAAFGLMAGYRASLAALAAPRLPAAHGPPPRARRALSSAAPTRPLALPHRTGVRKESA